MKRLFALLLAALMVLGMAACGGKPNPTEPTDGRTDPTEPTGGTQTGVVIPSDTFKGTTLEIWGFNKENYSDFETMGKGNYIWMMMAAMEEWAAIAGVTLDFRGSYDQGSILADINSGAKPDLIFQDNQFPNMVNLEMVAALSDEETKLLADACGDVRYLEMMTTKGAAYGFVYPWSGNVMLYYNKTMFERYDVKTPKEYYMEDNWNWTTLKKVMQEMTRDVNGDGQTDTYGLGVDSAGAIYPGMFTFDRQTGKLSSNIDKEISREWLEFVYEGVSIKGTIKRPGPHNIQKNIAYPMYAMQVSDCEPYNYEHLYQSIPNGDILEVVPVPLYDGEAETQYNLLWTQSAASVCKATDNRDAAINLLCYIIQCGRKYLDEFSLGAVPYDLSGIQGTCEYSKTWKEHFAEICEQRAEDIKEWDFDQVLVDKFYKTFEQADNWQTAVALTGVSFNYKEVYTMPPASSIPAIKEKWQAQLDTYNSLYS